MTTREERIIRAGCDLAAAHEAVRLAANELQLAMLECRPYSDIADASEAHAQACRRLRDAQRAWADVVGEVRGAS